MRQARCARRCTRRRERRTPQRSGTRARCRRRERVCASIGTYSMALMKTRYTLFMSLNRFIGATIVALTLSAAALDAKVKDRVFVGCVEARAGKYALVTTSVKGKARTYTLLGSHDFSKDVGHRVRVS